METEFKLSSINENICIKEEISEPDGHYSEGDKGKCELQCTCDPATGYYDMNNGAMAPSTLETINGTGDCNECCTCDSTPQYGPCDNFNCCNICIKEEPIDDTVEATFTSLHDAQVPDVGINQNNNGGSDSLNLRSTEINNPVLVEQDKQRKKRKNVSSNSDKIKVKIVQCTPKSNSNQDALSKNKQKGSKKRTPYVVIKEKIKSDDLYNKSTKAKNNVGLRKKDDIESRESKPRSAKSIITPTKSKENKKVSDLTDSLLDLSGTETEPTPSEQVSKLGSKVTYKCEVCQKILATKLSFQRHRDRYHETTRKMYKCTACDRAFSRKDKLSYHLKNLCPLLESYDPQSMCQICKLSFYDVRSVQRHMKSRHFLVPSENGFTCQKCDVSIESLDKFNCHYEPTFTQHTKSRQNSNFYNKTCEVCKVPFDSIKDLQNHMPTHFKEGNYECNRCESKYSLLKNLLRHIRQVHNVQTENFVCAVCDKSFVRKDVLRKHMLSHTDAKEYVCKICKKRFNRRDCMMSHMKHIHVPESEKHEYKKESQSCCEACGSVFRTAFLLREHIMKIHEGKAVECKLCGYQSLNRVAVYSHVKIEHKKKSSIGFILYKPRKPDTKAPVETLCEFCNKRLCSRQSFMAHVRLLHPEKYEKVKKQNKKSSKKKQVKDETKKQGDELEASEVESSLLYDTSTNMEHKNAEKATSDSDETVVQETELNDFQSSSEDPDNLPDKVKLRSIIRLQAKKNSADRGNIFDTFGSTTENKSDESFDKDNNDTIDRDDFEDDDEIVSYETDFDDCESE